MVEIIIRDLNTDNESELDLVVNRCIKTVLETIPEFDNNMQKTREQYRKFSFNEM